MRSLKARARFVSFSTRNVFHLRFHVRYVKLWHLSFWTFNYKTERLCQQHNNQVLIKNELSASKRIRDNWDSSDIYKIDWEWIPLIFVPFARACHFTNNVIKVNYLLIILANSAFNKLSTDVGFRGSSFTNFFLDDSRKNTRSVWPQVCL